MLDSAFPIGRSKIQNAQPYISTGAKMVSSKSSPCSSVVLASRKLHLLTLPFEIRRKILEFAWADSQVLIYLRYGLFSSRQEANSYAPDELLLLLSCSQLYSEARNILAGSLCLKVSSRYFRISNTKDIELGVTEGLFKSPKAPTCLKYSPRFVQKVQFDGWNAGHQQSPYSPSWLDDMFPSLRCLYLGKGQHIYGLGAVRSNTGSEPRKIVEKSGLSESWAGRLTLGIYDERHVSATLQTLRARRGSSNQLLVDIEVFWLGLRLERVPMSEYLESYDLETFAFSHLPVSSY